MVGLSTSDPGVVIAPTASRMALPLSDYVIGPGDVVGISVWKDDSLTRTVVVLPDGKITFPLLGDLDAGGKTVAQLKQILEAGLTRYVADSSVTVEVKQSNSMIIYIIGRVNAPGRQVLVANTNVLQALAMAGGPNPFAQKSKVKIFRQEEGKTAMFLFDYNAVAEGRHLEMNIELKRGDVIIVP
jgi:polysaccharide export outer membrane protein